MRYVTMTMTDHRHGDILNRLYQRMCMAVIDRSNAAHFDKSPVDPGEARPGYTGHSGCLPGSLDLLGSRPGQRGCLESCWRPPPQRSPWESVSVQPYRYS